nr:hypothetical protein Iba_chr05cCG8260 [Ipomoea batatas]GMC99716.1 hypothetical protein Iba_chr05eCG8350 [Ipomoea batatas]
MTSRVVQTRRLVAAEILVFRTAKEAVRFAALGAPPLKPDHPIHRSPAPASISSTFREPRNSRSEVDNIAAGIVNNAPVEEKAAAPEAKRAHRVTEHKPKRHKSHPSFDIHPAQNRPGQQDHSNSRERELEINLGRHGIKRLNHRGSALSPERQKLIPEGHAVTEKNPTDENRGEGVESHESRVHRPFLLHYAPVEDNEARHALEPHQGARRHLPCVVAFV